MPGSPGLTGLKESSSGHPPNRFIGVSMRECEALAQLIPVVSVVDPAGIKRATSALQVRRRRALDHGDVPIRASTSANKRVSLARWCVFAVVVFPRHVSRACPGRETHHGLSRTGCPSGLISSDDEPCL